MIKQPHSACFLMKGVFEGAQRGNVEKKDGVKKNQ